MMMIIIIITLIIITLITAIIIITIITIIVTSIIAGFLKLDFQKRQLKNPAGTSFYDHLHQLL